ncbi:hypothetical protein [Paenibacillus sp. GYB003]|uniref:hypothetical protein n=1 Tax=Paenibacillus sp. GYB003 TaxID=2994392 RepID=UPI002F964677
MGIVFVEYKVFPEKREAYLSWVREWAGAYPELQHYEGTDQPNLFVELWPNVDADRYVEFKRSRVERPERPWTALEDFVPGGLPRVHVWHFRRTNG